MKKDQKLWGEYRDHFWYVIISGSFIIMSGIYAFMQNDLFSLIIFLYFVGDALYKVNGYYHTKAKIRKQVEAITYRVKYAGEKVFNDLPLGILLYDEKYEIAWFNQFAKKVFEDELIGSSLQIVNQKLYDKILKGEAEFEIQLDENTYSFIHDKEERILYLTNRTDFAKLRQNYIDEQPVVGFLVMDNYDEVIHNLNEQEKSELHGKIISLIMQWADQHNILVRATASDRFILMFSNEVLQQLREKKFTIIDRVREVAKENDVLLTMSMGIATGYDDFAEIGQRANYMLDLALSRGGDQAAIKIASEDKFLFYGGKTNPVEKRNRVRARVNAQSYERLVRDSDRVVIMGHRFPDVDAIGASIGLLRMGVASKKEAYIV
ncbi:MAG: DHH family phosphoesterase, partial [Turicibacter sp.]